MGETIKIESEVSTGTKENAGAGFSEEEKQIRLYVVVMRRYYEYDKLENSSYIQAIFSSKEEAEKESKREEKSRGGKYKGFVEEYGLNTEWGKYACQNWVELYG